jgi:hypothetical protein
MLATKVHVPTEEPVEIAITLNDFTKLVTLGFHTVDAVAVDKLPTPVTSDNTLSLLVPVPLLTCVVVLFKVILKVDKVPV